METAFDVIKAEEAQEAAGADNRVADFTRLYAIYLKACAWMDRHKDATVWDRQRFYRLGRRVELGWGGLSDEQRSCAVASLCASGVLSRFVLRVLDVFGGKVAEVV